jgi:guanyl-specific ribonuclease Sa
MEGQQLSSRRLVVAALCVLLIGVGVWALIRTQSPGPSATETGVPACQLHSLPAEVADTVRAIRSNGPFRFPQHDGVVFGNREGHLPQQAKGYYHEYTVISPGAGNRSTRRVVTGGPVLTKPLEYYYTGDHYDSFCLVTDAGG